MSKITFEKANLGHKEIIFSWLSEPHIKATWDNSQSHKDDIINFMDGRKTTSSYCGGNYIYWIAKFNEIPFAMIMTIQESHKENIDNIKLENLSRTGNSYGIDFMIGNINYLGKGLASETLVKFVKYFRKHTDFKADTFLIDPANDNPQAKHVYLKAGFQHIGDFIMKGNCSGKGKTHHLLVKKNKPLVTLCDATIDDHHLIQNMARFYVYDLSRECGHTSSDWNLPANGLYESFDFKNYFSDKARKAYLIKVYDEIAGFALLNKATTDNKTDWNMGELFIIARFQNLGIGGEAVSRIWQKHPGTWEISVIPENKSALLFWGKIISQYTKGNFEKDLKYIDYDSSNPRRAIFKFIS